VEQREELIESLIVFKDTVVTEEVEPPVEEDFV